jgi:hypothetical protein
MRLTRWIAGGFAAGRCTARSRTGKGRGQLARRAPVARWAHDFNRDDRRRREGRAARRIGKPGSGPGKIPLTTVSATDRHLAFTVRPAQISYEGEWVEAEQHWSGVFVQGGKIPLTFRRGLPPARSVVEGLDGLWQGVVARNAVNLRLVLRVATTDRGTIVTFDSPDLGAAGLPVAGFSRRAQEVGFSVPASDARFTGTLSDDASGNWRTEWDSNCALDSRSAGYC